MSRPSIGSQDSFGEVSVSSEDVGLTSIQFIYHVTLHIFSPQKNYRRIARNIHSMGERIRNLFRITSSHSI